MQRRPKLLDKYMRPSVGKTKILLKVSTSCCMEDQGPDQRSKHQLARECVIILGRSERKQYTVDRREKTGLHVYVVLMVLV